MQMGNEEPLKKKKVMRVEDIPDSNVGEKDKGKTILINSLPVPRMVPVEEVLNIELFPDKTGMTAHVGAKMESGVPELVIECIRRNADSSHSSPLTLKESTQR